MRAECRVLVIAENESVAGDLRRTLGDELTVVEALSPAEPEVFQLLFESVAPEGVAGIGAAGRYDLAIIALPGNGAETLLADGALRDAAATLIVVLDEPLRRPPAWRRRHRHDALLVRPFSETGLRSLVERQLLLALREVPAAIPDMAYLAFLGDLIGEGRTTIEPVLGDAHPDGVAYPAVAAAFGFTVDDRNLLERLSELGLCRRRVATRQRRCGACGGQSLSLGEVCPGCESTDYAYESVKDEGGVRQRRLVCRACGHRAERALLLARCLDCHRACPPERTREHVVHRYELTAQAEEAVASGRIAGFALANALRNQHAHLHSRAFFLAELAREAERHRAYGAPCSVLMVRLAGLESLPADRSGPAVQAAWRAVTGVLRKCDVACVWGEDSLAALLPGSPGEGARLVARRLEQQLTALAPTVPSASVAATSIGEDGADGLMRDALGLVGIAIESPDEVFVDDGSLVVIEDDLAEAILDINAVMRHG